MCRNDREKKTVKTNQIGVVDVAGFIEQKKIRVAQKHQRRADAVEKAQGHEQSEHTEHGPMNVKPVARPGMDPRETVIFKEKAWLDPVMKDRTVPEITADLPGHK